MCTFANKTRTGMEIKELSSYQEAHLFTSRLDDWQEEPTVITYGAIVICRKGKASIRVNFDTWQLYEGAVITLFPNDVVYLKTEADGGFEAEILKYNASLLREASLQLEQTVYSALREDRCRQDTPIVTNIINGMFYLLKVYFSQPECTCVAQLVLLQLKAFFVGFHEYLQRNPQYRSDEVRSHRVRELFNHFMMLLERDFKKSRDVSYFAGLMNITPKYLTNIVRQVTGHTPKTIIDQYVVLQLKTQLQLDKQSIKQLAWEYHFTDVSFFCRYFKKHTGKTPQQVRELKTPGYNEAKSLSLSDK